MPLGRCDVDVGGQGAFQVRVVYEAQGEVEGREGVQSLRVIEALRSQIAIVGAVAGFGRRWQVRIEKEGQG